MRYLIKTNLHLNLGCNKFLIGSYGMRVGAVLADEATACLSAVYGQQVSELSDARQFQLEESREQRHSEVDQPVHIEVPKTFENDFEVKREIL